MDAATVILLLLLLACPLGMFFMHGRGGHGAHAHGSRTTEHSTHTPAQSGHAGHGCGALRSLQALIRDPVCGMLIDPARARASFEQDGERLLFCSHGCRDEFLRDRDTHEGYTSATTTEREDVR